MHWIGVFPSDHKHMRARQCPGKSDPMQTDCTSPQLEFQGFEKRTVSGKFDAGRVSSDGGVLLLREVAEHSGLLRRFADCFTDYRDADLIEHTVQELVSQRVLGLACGYEDLNDHDTLRDDPVMALACGKKDVLGAHRKRRSDQGHGLAGKSTLNRLERTPEKSSASERYHKVVYDGQAIDNLLLDVALQSHAEPPEQIVLDVDATDDPLHGKQEGRFFHGYYRHYCYLPLYIFWGDLLLCARLRPADIDGAAGCIEELERIVEGIRQRWPQVQIIFRGDSGFAREAIMQWCEAHQVDYVLGLAKNTRLKVQLADELLAAKTEQKRVGGSVRRFKDFRYQTLKSWARQRRVVGKAEQLPGKSNPRFVVTSLPSERIEAAALYEQLYCARGDMENRIKEQQLGLFADRTSTHTMRGNQLRLYFSSLAYVLVNELRRVGLKGTPLQRAQCSTIRTRLLKIGALLKLSVRRVVLSMSSAFPLQSLFAVILAQIRQAYPLRP